MKKFDFQKERISERNLVHVLIAIEKKINEIVDKINELEKSEDFTDKLNKQIKEDGDVLGHDELL